MVWWHVQSQTFETRSILWKKFKETFESKYYLEGFRDARYQKFLNICQGDCNVLDYLVDFNKLAEFCSSLVATNADHRKFFIQGLAFECLK